MIDWNKAVKYLQYAPAGFNMSTVDIGLFGDNIGRLVYSSSSCVASAWVVAT